MASASKKSFGWIPDYPDFRDYTEETQEVRDILAPAGGKKRAPARSAVDLRECASAVEDQGALGSCTAQAGAGVIEYYERKSFGRHIDASRLFLYKVTRNLMKMKGDTGAYLRLTMGAMVLTGTTIVAIAVIAARLRSMRCANSAREIPPGVKRIKSRTECLLTFFMIWLEGVQEN